MWRKSASTSARAESDRSEAKGGCPSRRPLTLSSREAVYRRGLFRTRRRPDFRFGLSAMRPLTTPRSAPHSLPRPWALPDLHIGFRWHPARPPARLHLALPPSSPPRRRGPIPERRGAHGQPLRGGRLQQRPVCAAGAGREARSPGSEAGMTTWAPAFAGATHRAPGDGREHAMRTGQTQMCESGRPWAGARSSAVSWNVMFCHGPGRNRRRRAG